MEKSYSSQKGFGMIMIVIIVTAVLVLATVVWFLLARDDSSSDSAQNTLFSGSYFAVLDRGEALQCMWQVPENTAGEHQAGQGELYTDGNSRGYSTAAFEAQGGTTAVFAVFEPEYVYTWFATPGSNNIVGTKIPVNQLESAYQNMSGDEQQQAVDIRANDYSFECEPWEVDESLLTPPSDVNFTEITP